MATVAIIKWGAVIKLLAFHTSFPHFCVPQITRPADFYHLGQHCFNTAKDLEGMRLGKITVNLDLFGEVSLKR